MYRTASRPVGGVCRTAPWPWQLFIREHMYRAAEAGGGRAGVIPPDWQRGGNCTDPPPDPTHPTHPHAMMMMMIPQYLPVFLVCIMYIIHITHYACTVIHYIIIDYRIACRRMHGAGAVWLM